MVRPVMRTWLGALALSAACYVGPQGSPDDGEGSTESDGDAPAPASCEAEAIGAEPMPMVRLRAFEYDNTIEDLLGDTTRPAQGFTADERLGVFEGNVIAPVGALAVEQYLDAAEAIAERAGLNLDALLPCSPGEPDSCARTFIEQFGRRAFRRPLTPDEIERLFAVYAGLESEGWAGPAPTFTDRIEVVLAAILQSPHLLYRVERGEPGDGDGPRRLLPHELATRLSFLLWASTPDDALLDAADADALDSPDAVEAHARRMMDDPRFDRALDSFHRQWLGIDHPDAANKDTEAFPMWDEALHQAAAQETQRMVRHVVRQGDGRLATLLTTPLSYVDASLAQLYGVEGPSEGFAQVSLDPTQRAGVLTHASVLAAHADAVQGSPVRRGVLVRERLLCQPLPPPPPTVDDSPPPLDPTASTRERFAQHTADPSCAGCHELIDPIGFGFSGYDAVGAVMITDGGRPVDARGELVGTDDLDGEFVGVVQLASSLAQSEQVHRCVAQQWMTYALSRPPGPAEQCSADTVADAFIEADGDLRELLVAIVRSDAFSHLAPSV